MVGGQPGSAQRTLWRLTLDQRFNRHAFEIHAVVGLRHGQQHVDALRRAGGTSGDMQTVRNEGVLKLQHFFG